MRDTGKLSFQAALVGVVVALVALVGSSFAAAQEDSAQQPANSAATGAPTITGTAEVGQTLTADPSEIADLNGMETATLSYQWVRNDGHSDTRIGDATGSTYKLVAADETHTIKVKVSFTDDADYDEELVSDATDAVAVWPGFGQPVSVNGQPQKFETVGERDPSEVRFSPSTATSSGSTLWLLSQREVPQGLYSTYTRMEDTAAAYSTASGSFGNMLTESENGRLNSRVTAIYSDGTTMWSAGTPAVTHETPNRVIAVTLSSGVRVQNKDFNLVVDNLKPAAMWSDGTTMWVLDSDDDKFYTYDLTSRNRDSSHEFNLHEDNSDAGGAWSDGTTMWVSDSVDAKVYAYYLESGDRREDHEFTIDLVDSEPKGITSNGTTMWVVNNEAVYSYQINREPLPANIGGL